MHPILDSIQQVVQVSQFVRFDAEAAQSFVKNHLNQVSALSVWSADDHFNDGTDRTLAYVFVLDTLNFCFWGKPRWKYRHQDQLLDGYMALAACLKNAFVRGDPLDDASYLAQLDLSQVEKLLDGEEGQIPLLDSRLRVLREAGKSLLENFDGKITNLMAQANGSVLSLVELLADHFVSYRDEANYRGFHVCLYKRAQIFCADVYGTFKGQGWGQFHDVDQLTAFADYKLPQLLRAHKVLHYEPSLAEKVDAQIELPMGSSEEIEIRAFTIHAVEQLKQIFADHDVQLKSFEVDWLLWHLSQGIDAKPYHRTRTVFY